MSKRTKLPHKASTKLFTRTAQRVHPKNTMMPLRGGIRA